MTSVYGHDLNWRQVVCCLFVDEWEAVSSLSGESVRHWNGAFELLAFLSSEFSVRVKLRDVLVKCIGSNSKKRVLHTGYFKPFGTWN